MKMKTGNVLLLLLVAVVGWWLWRSWAASQQTATTIPTNLSSQPFLPPGASGTYYYGPSGLQAWSSAPPVIATPFPPTWQVPNWPPRTIGLTGGGGITPTTGGPILTPGGAR